jgi:hypothetical protein
MFTVYVTATRDNLSSHFSCSNDSNGLLKGRKLMRGLGMCGNLVAESGVPAGPGKARWFPRGWEAKSCTLRNAGIRHPQRQNQPRVINPRPILCSARPETVQVDFKFPVTRLIGS